MTFVWTGGVLTPDIAFVSLTLFNIIRMPMNGKIYLSFVQDNLIINHFYFLLLHSAAYVDSSVCTGKKLNSKELEIL